MYQKSSTILAADLNGFLSTTNNVYGVGNSDRGYGQTAIVQGAVSVGGPIFDSHWTHLRNMVVVCANHQGTSISTLPPSGAFADGQPIIAHEQAAPSSNAYELANNVTAIDTNRLNVSGTSMTLTTGVWTVTRATSWVGSIIAEVSVTWADENHARYFFNSGGQIRMTGSEPTGTWEGNLWNAALTTGLGTLKFAAHATTNTGTIPGSAAIGYYELTDTYQIIFHDSATIGGAFYTTTGNQIVIEAKRLNHLGVNGGNGNGVQFHILLEDTGIYATRTVPGGTSFSFDNLYATTFLSGIATGTYATITPF